MTPGSTVATAPIAGVRVRGGASAEDLAAVLAVLAVRGRGPAAPVGYERWRSGRLAALRRTRA